MLKPLFQNQKIKFESLKEGFHHLVVKTAKVAMSKSNKQMLVVELDCTSDDEQPNFFSKKSYEKNGQKIWPFDGIKYLVIYDDDDGTGNYYFQNFCDAIVNSNPGFTINWDLDEDVFGNQFQGLHLEAYFQKQSKEYNGVKSEPVVLKYFVIDDAIVYSHQKKQSQPSSVLEGEQQNKKSTLYELLNGEKKE